ncbi:uncharacterized protein [Procambarus clarkii]|uniref:uncharacterized protein n=1 Tax=Procambarus clarkii TaxID=6728 RepID=UPI003741EEB5
MQGSLWALLAVLAVVCGLTTSLLVPVATTLGATSAAVTVGAGTLTGVGATAAVAGVASLGIAALTNRERGKFEEIFAMVAKVDTQECGLRYVCQVFTKPRQDLNLRERAIRLLVGEKPQPVPPKKAQQARALYQSAGALGQRGEDCLALYQACPLSFTQVTEYLDSLDLQLKKRPVT